MLELNSINCEYGKISYQINRFDNGPIIYGYMVLAYFQNIGLRSKRLNMD